MSSKRELWFWTLSVAAFMSLNLYVARSPAVLNEPALQPGKCLLRDGTKAYDFLPPAANDILCYIFTFFGGIRGNKPAELLAQCFGSMLFPVATIMVYESFRHQGVAARLATPIIMAGQLLSIAVASPMYFALATSSKAKAIQKGRVSVLRPPSTEYIWTALLSTSVGYLGLTGNMEREKQSYDSMAMWQVFPLVMLAINIVLPFLLRPILRRTSPSIPIFIIGTLGVYLSAAAHFKLFSSGIDLRKAFVTNWPQMATFSEATHLFFLLDFLFTFITIASHVSFSYYDGDIDTPWSTALACFFGAQLLGPGAIISMIWAYRELFEARQQVIVHRAVPVGASQKLE